MVKTSLLGGQVAQKKIETIFVSAAHPKVNISKIISTMHQYHIGFSPILKIHAMKNNILIVDCFNYVKCIVSIICGGNRTQVRTS